MDSKRNGSSPPRISNPLPQPNSVFSKIRNPWFILPLSIFNSIAISLIFWAWTGREDLSTAILSRASFPGYNPANKTWNKYRPGREQANDCLVLNQSPQLCARDERIWSESLTHPSILWHYAPRRVLILGPLGGPLVAESLRHFTLTEITWVSDLQINNYITISDNAKRVLDYMTPSSSKKDGFFKNHFQYDDVIDELNRSTVNHGSLDAFFSNTTRGSYDVVLIDHLLTETYGPDLVDRAEKVLVVGGIMSIADKLDSGIGLLNRLASKFKNVHVGLEHVDSTNSKFLFYYASKSDVHISLQSMAPTYVDALVGRRIFDGDEDLDHYDGVSHQRLFSIPLLVRKKLHAIISKARPKTDFPITYEPHPNVVEMKAHDVPGVTVTRDYFGCNNSILGDGDDVMEAVKTGLALAHAKIVNINLYQHTGNEQFATNVPKTPVDSDDEESEDEDSEQVHKSKNSILFVIATLADGHLTLRCFPGKNYASAEYTSYDPTNDVSPEEALGSIGDKFNALRSVGGSVPRGIVMPSVLSYVDHWHHDTNYWMSSKVLSKVSKTAGRGQFARVNISKGEVLFKGPIETYLLHEREIKKLPAWRTKYVNHMGEQAEDDIWISPPLYDEDESYFTNHNCNANLIYQGYDTMIARRDIGQGEELTFDYATADAEPRPIFKCNCGASSCRGKIHGNDWMRDDVVDNYGVSAFWPHIQKKILRRRAGLPVSSMHPSYARD